MRACRIASGACAAMLLLALAPVARADTRRLAVIVGNNAGAGDRAPLRFAEVDAGKVARVLVELGGVAPADLLLLQGRSMGEVRQALEAARRKVEDWHRKPDTRVVLLFYFSGHSDGEALELGRERFGFPELRRALSSTSAEVRLAIVDSCKSGALLAVKGGQLGPAFQVRLTEDLASTGEVLLTSSAADELALESNEIRGSFFTHHFVSGLRGAADTSGDGMVTLAEAYQYAFAHTVSATAGTVIGPQHPAYDYRLSGQGELVLAELLRPTAALELPKPFERALIVQLVRDQVIAELASGAAARVAVPPGEYAVRVWRAGRIHAGRVFVAEGQSREIAWRELSPADALAPRAKGDGPFAGIAVPTVPTVVFSPEERTVAARASTTGPHLSLMLAMGAQSGIANGMSPLVSGRFGWRSVAATGFAATIDLATGDGASFRESFFMGYIGYRLGLERGAWRAFAGLELGGGGVLQSGAMGSTSGSSGLFAWAPWAGAGLHLGGPISLVLESHFPMALLKRDGETALAYLPAGWLGLLMAL